MPVFLVMCLSAGLVAAEAPTSGSLRAGAATSNITPDLGAKIIGGIVPFPATGVQQFSEAKSTALILLQAFRIGDVCIGSPLKHSFMVELNHGYFGYLPTLGTLNPAGMRPGRERTHWSHKLR